MDYKIGDSVYVRSKGWMSNAIAYISSGGKNPPDCPSHSARIFDIQDGRIRLIEVMFTGKRFYYLDDYIKQGAKVWIKRDDFITDDNVNNLLEYLQALEVKRYDWGLILGFLNRFMLRKVCSKWNWDWVTKVLDKRMCFVCSEFQNAGRRAIGMDIKENETPYDNMRKIPAKLIIAYNV
jgi:hypothetical protein